MTAQRDAPVLEVYVWFEADPAAEVAVRAAVDRLADAMLRGGSEAPAERPRLLRRAEPALRDGVRHTTWMEVWPAVPRHAYAGWAARLAASAASCGLQALTRGGRHVEPFEIEPAPTPR